MSIPSGMPVGSTMQTVENYTLPKPVDNQWYKTQIAEKKASVNDLLERVSSLDVKIHDINVELQYNADMDRNNVQLKLDERTASKICKSTLLEEVEKIKALQAALEMKWKQEIAHEAQLKSLVKQDYRELTSELESSEKSRSALLTQIEELDDPDAIFKTKEKLKKINQRIEQIKSVIPKMKNYIILESQKTDGISYARQIGSKPAHIELGVKLVDDEERKKTDALKIPMNIISSSYSQESTVFSLKIRTNHLCQFEANAHDSGFEGFPGRVTLEIVAIPIQAISSSDDVELSFYLDRSVWKKGRNYFIIDVVADTPEQKRKVIKSI